MSARLGLSLGLSRGKWNDGRILDLDLLHTASVPLGTYTRATGGYTFNSSGILVANTANQPRPDYDPATLVKRGWLMDGSRTNLLLYSEDFRNTADAGSARPWVYTDCSLTPNAAVAPDGATTADKIIRTSGTGIRGVRQSYAATSGQSGTFSFYAKAAEYGFVGIVLYNSQGRATVNLSTLATATYGPATTVTATSVGNGWVRCSITRTWDVTGDVSPGITVQNSIDDPALCPSQGDGTSGIYLWGAQLEAATFPSSYIPTTTLAASRSADLWTISNAQFLAATGQNIPQAEGTALLIYEAAALYDTNLTVANMLFINDGGTDHVRIYQYRNRLGIAVAQGGVGTVDHYIGSLTNGVHKVAMRWKANDCNIAVDGVASTADATCATMPTTNTISLGVDAFGRLRGVRIYPFAMTDAQLQALTS